jgi:hypothetical protein
MKIKCKTVFDCTRTGVTGHYRASQTPFTDRSGQVIDNLQHWTRSRNQQRNYETLLQIFGLRTQPLDISSPEKIDGVWEFEFSVESGAVFSVIDQLDSLAGLKHDCQGVPMIADVNNVGQQLSILSPEENIWFDILNTATEN